VTINAAINPKFWMDTLKPVSRRINSDGIGRIITSIAISRDAPNRPI
jgi:hypothetical protein